MAFTASTNAAGDSETVLSVEGISKKFCRSLKRSLFYAGLDIYSDIAFGQRDSDKLRKGEFWALKDISFALKKGEALGLVGPNGSGKTTLLRLISGLIKPDTGSISVKGRLAPLIALGAGFNPILTGRENIVVNLSILGLTRKEINQAFERVIEFAEIEDAIDAPLRTYSSGMAARLGFACAIQVRPDVLLIDEVLAVGDIQFRMKCYRELALLKRNGTSFILVSHNPNLILANCATSMLVHRGQILDCASTQKILDSYEGLLFPASNTRLLNRLTIHKQKPDTAPDSPLNITEIFFRNCDNEIVDEIKTAQDISLCLKITCSIEIRDLNINILIKRAYEEMGWIQSLTSPPGEVNALPGNSEIRLVLSNLILGAGAYLMKMSISSRDGYMYDAVERFDFTVSPDHSYSGSKFYQPHRWEYVIV